MDINMNLNNNLLNKNLVKDNSLDILDKKKNKKNKKRELLINSFIKKFPKVKLHTIIEINKYYNENYEKNDESDEINLSENQIINNYLINNYLLNGY